VSWSPDGNVLYFLSDRDGWRCIWAQRVEAFGKRPLGAAFPVYHFHEARRTLTSKFHYPEPRIWVARDKMVFELEEVSGNIWMQEGSQR
jgi:hypothetical protein